MKARNKTRLYGNTKAKLPNPTNRSRSYEVKSLDQADGRFSVVKRLRQRLQRLVEETDATTEAKEILANRAIFLLAYLESQEVQSLNGESVSWKNYLSVCKMLTDVLKALGLTHAAKSSKTLEAYLEDAKRKNGKLKIHSG